METEIKSSPARAATKTAAPAAERFVEVELVKKYVPHHCYEVEDGVAMLLRDTEGKPVLQRDVHIDTVQDKFGQPKKIFREVFQALPPGTRLEIPRSDAETLVNAGKARISMRQFE